MELHPPPSAKLSRSQSMMRTESLLLTQQQQKKMPYEKPPVGEALAPANANQDNIPMHAILPLFLTTMTQDIFKIKSNDDVTAEKPIKIIPKADLIADIMARRAISDFQPALQQIQEFPGDELVVYFDADFKFGQNFFLCISPEAVDYLFTSLVSDIDEDGAGGISGGKKGKKPQPKIWECLGSDKDIDLERVFNTRDLIHVKISRQRKEFGKTCNFSDKTEIDPVMECKSYKDPLYEVNKMELGIAIQSIPETATKSIQTNWFRPVNFSVQYEPRTIPEETRKEILDADQIIDFVKSVTERFEKVLQQNSIMDIFKDDFKNLGEEEVTFEKGSHSYLQEYQSFTDLQHSKDKSISCTDWHPTQKGVIAVSCAQRSTFDDRITSGFTVRSKQSLLLLWSFHDPIHPQLILEAPEDVNCFQFNPSDPNFIVAGCVNGQICLWDVTEYAERIRSSRKRVGEDESGGREGVNGVAGAAIGGDGDVGVKGAADEPVIPIVKYIVASSIEFGHRASISDLQWLPSNTLIAHNGEMSENSESGNRQLVTCSLDGQVCIWDTRSKKDLKALDLTWKPFLRVPLCAMDNTFDYGLTKVSLSTLVKDAEPARPKSNDKEEKKDGKKEASGGGHSKFFAVTEEGDLIESDLVAEKSSEDKGSRVEHAFSFHFGPMSDLQRSPFFPDILLSSGGWSFQIWKEKINMGPLLSSPTSQSYIISSRWSPTRPGVFFVSKADGTLEVWDLLDSTYQPATVQNVSSVGISHMTVRQYSGKAGQFVAAADDEGTLHILEVPKHLAKPHKNEKLTVRAFFDREVKRIQFGFERKQVRQREKGPWEQAKQEAAAALKAAQAAVAAAQAEAAKKAEEAAAAAASAAEGASAAAPPVPPPQDDAMEKAEIEYKKFERNFLEAEGFIQAEV